jgi:hypothetical protein
MVLQSTKISLESWSSTTLVMHCCPTTAQTAASMIIAQLGHVHDAPKSQATYSVLLAPHLAMNLARKLDIRRNREKELLTTKIRLRLECLVRL